MSGDRATKAKADAKPEGGKAADWDSQQDLVAGWRGGQTPAVNPGGETAWEPFADLVKEWQTNESKNIIATAGEDLLASEDMILIDVQVLEEVARSLTAKGFSDAQVQTAVEAVRSVAVAAAAAALPELARRAELQQVTGARPMEQMPRLTRGRPSRSDGPPEWAVSILREGSNRDPKDHERARKALNQWKHRQRKAGRPVDPS